MKAGALALRMLSRDWRSRELRLLSVALVVAVAAVTAVGFFTDRVEQAMEGQAAEMLAADLVIEAPDPLPEVLFERAEASGLRTARTLEFPSVVLRGEDPVLVQVKGVSDAYPLRGELRIAREAFAEGRPADGLPPSGGAWVEPRLLALLDASVGETIQLGEASLTLDRVITREPDRAWSLFRLAPRVLVRLDALDRTGLLGPASRVEHRLLVAGEGRAVADYRGWLEGHLPPGAEIMDLESARPELRLALERGRSFLALASLAAVVLAGVAVALATRRFTERQADASAVMRCLGASRRLVLRLFTVRLLGLGLIASLIGGAAGYAAQGLLSALLAEWFGGVLPPPSPIPLLTGLGVGLITLAGFALPPLLRLGAVPPLRVLRRELGVPRAPVWVAGSGAALALSALMFWQAGDPALAVRFIGGVAATLAVLVAAAAALVWAVTGLRHRTGTVLRYGLAGLARSPGTSAVQLAGFGVGITALLLLAVVRVDLLSAWERTLPEGAPNHFLINIQPEEVDDVRAFLEERGLSHAGFFPMMRARLVGIDSRRVDPDEYEDARAQRMAEREFNLTAAERMQSDNRITAGRWWDPAETDRPWFSIEEGIAETLGIELGDTLEFLIAGEPVRGEVTSLRSVRWDSFNPNFFVIGTPGLLEDRPATWITSFHLPPERVGVTGELVRAFPSVTVLDISALIGEVRAVMDRGSLAVEYVFLFTLAAGLVVLYAGIQASRESRVREAAVLRTLGMRRRRLLAGVGVEFATLGMLAGLLGATAAGLIGRALAARIFELPYALDPWLWLVAAGAGAAGVAAAGMAATYPLVVAPPLQVLRQS
ncbi:MAG: ABC transporter permease [Chromatiales bacterium]|jgi:putative ABC transport system permease protein